ncbi:RidA family protein [Marininema halotolerans]|uniref:2-iminobutanoate/2-iminopropanoate deaminase n=1 Tax=Marininema halotolerans TaxID=1155944 RepID=A0A1I6TCD0_9BACL|nr:RidA family protein [Marininema halotolerans]SFS86813.1 2-iminobutanoate/2-iminopropanoate deaminase [Marininema halotolerans]
MERIHTNQAPQAIGPYSQAIRTGSFIFASGQIPLTIDGVLVEGDIEAQTHQVMKNIQAVLQAANADLNRVVKTTIFLMDMDDFQQVNHIYGEWFGDHRPARSCVQVAQLPKGARVEIEAIAVVE